MKTSHEGTSLEALAKAAQRRGIEAKGFAVTEAGLRKVPLPCVALLMPGHLVLLDELGAGGARVWDPSARRHRQAGPEALHSAGVEAPFPGESWCRYGDVRTVETTPYRAAVA